MSGEGKIPEQEFEFSKWTSEQAVETLERADGPLKAPGALGVDPATVKAGAAVVLDVLNKLLAALGEIDRKVAIASAIIWPRH